MNALLLVAQNGLLLLMGTTVLLSLGCGAVLLCKSPVHRQRISELTIAGVLVWMVLALFPLPRLLPESWSTKPQAAEVQLPLELTPVPMDEVAPIPMVPESAPELPLTENKSDLPVGWPSQAVNDMTLDEMGSLIDVANEPSLDLSPSAEIAPLSPQLQPPAIKSEAVATAPPTWQFDSQKLAGLFTGAYLAGASLCLFWILAGYLLLYRIRQAAQAPPEWLANQYHALARQAGIAPPRLIVSRLCGRPLTWGMFWPVIVLPHSLCRQENKSQLRTILLHELGHIAQQDAQGNFLFCLALPLLYAHPLYWWLRRDSQLAAELVADDWAAWQTGKETYVEELVALARCTGTSSLPLVGVTGLFSSPSQFYRRMHMLLAREKPLSTKTSLPWRLASISALAGAVALAASLAGVRPAAGQAAPPAAAPAADEPVVAPPLEPVPVPLPASLAPPGLELPPIATPPAATPPAAVPAPPAIGLPEIKESPADPDEAALLAEIKQLQDKLRALEAKRGIRYYPLLGRAAPHVSGNTVVVTKVDADGKIWTETWTTDGKGQPDKIISISGHNLQRPAPPVALSPDGKTITKEYVDKDGSRHSFLLDAATGKVIAENHTGGARYTPTRDTTNVVPPSTIAGKPVPRKEPRTDYPIPVVGKGSGIVVATPPAQDAYAPLVAARPAGVPSAASADRQLDLVSLATSYADAVSVLEAAEAKMTDIARLGDSNAISQQEVTAAKLGLSAAKRKERLLRSIAEAATEGAAQDFERSSRLYKEGEITGAAAAEAKTRLAILKQILGTRPAVKDPVPSKQ